MRGEPILFGLRRRRIVAALAATAIEESDRWPLWIPVAVAIGAGVYFALPSEPPLAIGPAAFLALLVSALAVRGRRALLVALLGLGACVLGFAAAQLRTAMVAAPILEETIGPLMVEGAVLEVEVLDNGRRIVLAPDHLRGLADRDVPALVRIRTGLRGATPAVGQRIRVLAKLRPPPPPIAPGAFDFQRRAYFERLGGTGFALGQVEIIADSTNMDGGGRLWMALERLRDALYQRILSAPTSPESAVAGALLIGERGAIPDPVLEHMRDSGLAHLLAISGLHIGLVAGFVFFSVRAALALWPALALRFPIKKWAAAAAFLVALIYLLLSGATIPTQRAFLMIGLVLLAVMVDRIGVSMRLVAWAALIVLLIAPDALLGASFQLSFSAVIGLVAVYEMLRDRYALTRKTWWQRPLWYLGGVALTTLVATSATTPFAMFHFNRLTLYGLVANMIAVPITAFWIMPLGLMSLCLMPFGLEAAALIPMNWGIGAVLDVAEVIAGWPGAVRIVSSPPAWGMLALSCGGLWLCLWRRRWRWLGAGAIVVGLASIMTVRPPDVLVSHDARLAAVRVSDGSWLFSDVRRESFVRDGWLRLSAAEAWAGWPAVGPDESGSLTCDPQGCLFRRGGRTVALVRQRDAAADDCGRVDAVVALIPLPRQCRLMTPLVVDRFDLWRNGAHAIWLDANGIRIEAADDHRGNRPWVAKRDLSSGG